LNVLRLGLHKTCADFISFLSSSFSFFCIISCLPILFSFFLLSLSWCCCLSFAIFWFQPIDCENERTNERKKRARVIRKLYIFRYIWLKRRDSTNINVQHKRMKNFLTYKNDSGGDDDASSSSMFIVQCH
jgi:hypothetical protein